MEHPPLPDNVEVLPGTDVEGEWERFEVFEALHHSMSICNPMTDADLDQLVFSLAPQSGDRALDIACGHGELLIRLAATRGVIGTGIDLSPWVLARATERASMRVPGASLRWVLGNAHAMPVDRFEIVTCLGASWIWHGFAGTVRAMAERLTVPGRLAVGDLRLKDGADLKDVVETYGTVLTAPEQAAVLEQEGFEVVDRLDPGPASWDAYLERIAVSATAWQELHPGATADRYLFEQEQWRRDHDRDMQFLAWTVWVARR